MAIEITNGKNGRYITSVLTVNKALLPTITEETLRDCARHLTTEGCIAVLDGSDRDYRVGAFAALANGYVVALSIGAEPTTIHKFSARENGRLHLKPETLSTMWNASARYQIGELNYKHLLEEYNESAPTSEKILKLIACTGMVVK